MPFGFKVIEVDEKQQVPVKRLFTFVHFSHHLDFVGTPPGQGLQRSDVQFPGLPHQSLGFLKRMNRCGPFVFVTHAGDGKIVFEGIVFDGVDGFNGDHFFIVPQRDIFIKIDMEGEGNRDAAENRLSDFFLENTFDIHTAGKPLIFMRQNNAAELGLGCPGMTGTAENKQSATDQAYGPDEYGGSAVSAVHDFRFRS